LQTWVLESPANIWVPLCCHPLFGDVNQRKGGKRNNLSQTCKHELAETVFNGVRVYEWTPGFCHAKMSVTDQYQTGRSAYLRLEQLFMRLFAGLL